MLSQGWLHETKIRLRHNWRLLVAVLVPLAFSPMTFAFGEPATESTPDTNQKYRTAYVVTIMAIFWIFEVLPLAITSLFPLVLFPLLGIQHAATVSQNYMKESNMIFLGAIVIALAIEYSGLHIRIALCVIRLFGANPSIVMLGIMIITALMSMWISDTSCTSMLLPIVSAITTAMFREEQPEVIQEENVDTTHDTRSVVAASYLRSRRESNVFFNSSLQGSGPRRRSRLASGVGVPNSFSKATASMLPRVLQAQASNASKMSDSGVSRGTDESKSSTSTASMQEVSSMDIIKEGVAVGNHKEKTPMFGSTKKYDVEGASQEASNTTEDEEMAETQVNIRKMLLLSIAYAASIGGTGSLVGTGPIKVFKELIKKYKLEHNTSFVGITFLTWMGFNIPPLIVNIIITWVFLVLRYISFSKFKQKDEYFKDQAKIKEYLDEEYKKLGPISSHQIGVLVVFILMVLLWLLRDPQFFDGWDAVVKSIHNGDSTAAMFCVILLFVIPKSWSFLHCGEKAYQPGEKYEALLDWKFVSANAPWGYILLIGSGYAIADASDASGLSKAIGNELELLKALPNPVLLLIVLVITCVFTEVASNTACANLILPILFSVSCRLDIHPIYLTMASAVASSYAFMLPISSPPNAIIFATGELTVWEMVVNGFILNVLCVLVLFVAILSYDRDAKVEANMGATTASNYEKAITTVIKVGKIFGILTFSSKSKYTMFWQTVYCHYTMIVSLFVLTSTVISFVRDKILNTAISTEDYREGLVQMIQDVIYHGHIMGTSYFGLTKCKLLPQIFQRWESMELHLQYYEHTYTTKVFNGKKWKAKTKEMMFACHTMKSHQYSILKSKVYTISYVVVGLFGAALYFAYEYEKNDRPHLINYLQFVAEFYTVPELSTWYAGLFVLYFGHVLEILWAYGDILLFLIAFSLHYQFTRFNNVLRLACTVHAQNLNSLSLENLRLLHWALVKSVKESTNMLNSITLIVFVCNIIYLFSRVHIGLTEDFSSPNPIIVLEASFEFLYLIVRIFLTSCMAAAFHSTTTLGILYLARAKFGLFQSETFFNLLERFRNQIVSANVGITGSGYFVVNQSFVATVASALVTYQLMILQLHSTTGTPPSTSQSAKNNTVG